MGATALLHRYKAGERLFLEAHLVGAALDRAELCGVNLEHANLRRATLRGANLEGAILRGASLDGANLEGANLGGANLEGANLEGANFRSAILKHARLEEATLDGAHFSGAHLNHATLPDARLEGVHLDGASCVLTNLSGAHLGDAHLEGANLAGAYLPHAQLQRAKLGGAQLDDANLHGADLTGADLRGANLEGANLRGACLDGANLDNVALNLTILSNVDLSSFCQAHSTIRHRGPSIIDHSTILRSIQAPLLKDFLARAGVLEVFVEYMVESARSVTHDVFKLRSTYISYGGPDEAFARKLYEALHRNGVVTFFFPEHAIPGEKLHRMMHRKVNEYDRILLVCSAASLVRPGVLNEIEITLTREARDGGAAYLIPITLDNYVFTDWAPPSADTAQRVRDRVVADFRGADMDAMKFQSALLKLIGALRRESIQKQPKPGSQS